MLDKTELVVASHGRPCLVSASLKDLVDAGLHVSREKCRIASALLLLAGKLTLRGGRVVIICRERYLPLRLLIVVLTLPASDNQEQSAALFAERIETPEQAGAVCSFTLQEKGGGCWG